MAADKETRDIIAYLSDTLPPDRRAAFVARLATDAELQKKVRAHQRVEAGLRQLALERTLKNEPAPGVMAEAEVRPLWPPTRQQVLLAAAVLTVVAALFLIFSLQPPSPQALYTENYKPEGRLRGERLPPATLTPALDAYYNRRYASAIDKLQPLPEDSLFYRSYFLGLSQLALNRTDSAIAALSVATATPEPLLRYRVEWYLALAYLNADQAEKARDALTSIVNQPEQPFRDDAANILKQLK